MFHPLVSSNRSCCTYCTALSVVPFMPLIDRIKYSPIYRNDKARSLSWNVICSNSSVWSAVLAIVATIYSIWKGLSFFNTYAFILPTITLSCLFSLRPIFKHPCRLGSYAPLLLNTIALAGAVFSLYTKYCPYTFSPLSFGLSIVVPLLLQICFSLKNSFNSVNKMHDFIPSIPSFYGSTGNLFLNTNYPPPRPPSPRPTYSDSPTLPRSSSSDYPALPRSASSNYPAPYMTSIQPPFRAASAGEYKK